MTSVEAMGVLAKLLMRTRRDKIGALHWDSEETEALALALSALEQSVSGELDGDPDEAVCNLLSEAIAGAVDQVLEEHPEVTVRESVIALTHVRTLILATEALGGAS